MRTIVHKQLKTIIILTNLCSQTTMKTLKFHPSLVPGILCGTKTTTWRLFDDKDLREGDELSLLDSATRREFAEATIIKVKSATFAGLTPDDRAGHERFVSDIEMYGSYERYYNKKIGPATPVKIITFQLKNERFSSLISEDGRERL